MSRVVIWDGLNTHRSQKMRHFTDAREDWLTVVQLPGYAPDPNADPRPAIDVGFQLL